MKCLIEIIRLTLHVRFHQINSKAIEDAAQGKLDTLVVKRYCTFEEEWVGQKNVTTEVDEVVGNITERVNVTTLKNVTISHGIERCK